ncbi:hypothetical protein UFOVP784_105 [uncultured Caudovirales phage]|uniref:Uncharacterized protein n=1 Tax=uncultured Caudovirales phage TaxID=2100421 RepID=A0A6J5MD96_9CAUD|nr:hypothetical protein UFOVP436_105 [uncultured Caudovirales phage]CAB4162743.1 hypothetical protein UFOVP784_105 [uncultured Caudovirales phage]
MNDQKQLDITGEWDVSALTPFGVTKSKVIISSEEPYISGTIIGENGSLDFNNGKFEGDKLSFSTTVDTPIKATLFVNVDIINNKAFSGTLTIDQYMTISVKGNKNVNL